VISLYPSYVKIKWSDIITLLQKVKVQWSKYRIHIQKAEIIAIWHDLSINMLYWQKNKRPLFEGHL